MKILVTYYSYSGNTDRVARMFGKMLEPKGEVHVQRLKPSVEIKGFLAQCRAARKGDKAILGQGVKFDVASYDLVLIGSPVWAFAPVPSINTFLENLSGLKDKRVIVLLTSGSGLGVKHCFKHIRAILEAKGASKVDEINIPDNKNKDNDFVASSLQKVL
ncbi:MAG: flavodoxin [Candidatus Omnitrophica bacterium]|nr:flavodoxin [Candidatus Omnitrophota bacterium]